MIALARSLNIYTCDIYLNTAFKERKIRSKSQIRRVQMALLSRVVT